MVFTEEIKHLREKLQMPQRQLAAALEIDTATYCKIEKGERKAKREQVVMIAKTLKCKENELLVFWLADKIAEAVGTEKELANKAFAIAQQTINKNTK